jgi:hypothetical protein
LAVSRRHLEFKLIRHVEIIGRVRSASLAPQTHDGVGGLRCINQDLCTPNIIQ